MCLGNIDRETSTCYVYGICHLERSDKRGDRVEISPEQLSLAAMEAEKIAEETGRPTSVVGWYHSHPHMTCRPSHVDLRYQGDYQMLDPGFVGLIFSVFNEDTQNSKSRIQLHAWQATEEQAPVSDFNPSIYGSAMTEEELMAFTQMDAAQQTGGWAEHEVPIEIYSDVPGKSDLFQRLVTLMRIFYREEKMVYSAQTEVAASTPDALPSAPKSVYTRMHHAAVFQKTSAKLLECLYAPVKRALTNLKQSNERKLARLLEEEQQLQAALAQST